MPQSHLSCVMVRGGGGHAAKPGCEEGFPQERVNIEEGTGTHRERRGTSAAVCADSVKETGKQLYLNYADILNLMMD